MHRKNINIKRLQRIYAIAAGEKPDDGKGVTSFLLQEHDPIVAQNSINDHWKDFKQFDIKTIFCLQKKLKDTVCVSVKRDTQQNNKYYISEGTWELIQKRDEAHKNF